MYIVIICELDIRYTIYIYNFRILKINRIYTFTLFKGSWMILPSIIFHFFNARS